MDNKRIYEIGLTFPFFQESLTSNITFNKRFVFTHNDSKWEQFDGHPSFYKELVEIDLHSISHIDSLNHRGDNLIGYNNVQYTRPEEYKNGADSIPLLAGKGILIDIASFSGKNRLSVDTEITIEMIEECLQEQKTGLDDVKVILFRTGHIQLWNDCLYDQYFEKEPGINLDTAKWLSTKNIIAVGADNFAVEKYPSPEGLYPVHKHFLVEKGIYLIENLNLEELAENKLYTFNFIAAPIRFKGASGAFTNPVVFANIN